MASITTVPSQDVIRKAKETRMNVYDFIKKYNSFLAGEDMRARHKTGIFLEDFLITRRDGSKFSIHEIDSESPNLKKIIITLYENEEIKNITAYLDSIDFNKLQKDKQYLNIFSEDLLSANRIHDKVKVSRLHGNSEYIYMGNIIKDKRTGTYKKEAYPYETVENEISIQKRNIANSINRKELINQIIERLQEADLNTLEKIQSLLERETYINSGEYR